MRKYILFLCLAVSMLAMKASAQSADSTTIARTQQRIEGNLEKARKHQRKIDKSQRKIEKEQKKIKRQERKRERKIRRIEKEQKKLKQ